MGALSTALSWVRARAGRPSRSAGLAVSAPGAAALAARLGAFQAELDALFVELAGALPELARLAHEATAAVTGELDPVAGAPAEVSVVVEHLVTQCRAAAQEVLRLTGEGQREALAIGAAAGELSSQLAAASRLSLELRLAGFNASFSVDGLGERGAAFAAVNRALVEIAEQSRVVAQTLDSGAQAAAVAARRIEAGQADVTAQVHTALATVEEQSAAALEDARRALGRVAGVVGELTARSEAMDRAAADVMGAVQVQDIIRQGLDHLLLVLDALEHGGPAGAERRSSGAASAAFQVRAARLAGELVASLDAQLSSLVSSVETPLAALQLAFLGIEEKVRAEKPGLMALAELATPLAALESLTSGEGMASCTRELDLLQHALAALAGPLRLMEKVPLEIDVVRVLLRSETARLAELAEAARIIEQLEAVCAGYRRLGVEVAVGVRAMHGRLEVSREALGAQSGAWRGLVSGDAARSRGRERLERIGDRLGARLDSLVAVGPRVAGPTARMLELLRGLGTGRRVLDDLTHACQRWVIDAERVEADLVARGLGRAQTDEAMDALIDQFTIVAHATMAGGRDGPTEGGASAPGELTLF